MERGAIALEDGMAVRELARTHDLPCCTFVACWLLQVTGRVPTKPVADWKPWYKLAPDWWGKANIWDADLPYSSLEAAVDAGGGAIKITHDVSDERPAPALTPERWHVIQRWRPSGSGHTYLAYCDVDGETVTIIQSSVAKGYRHDVGTWTGLEGLDVGVATLEPLT